MSTNWKIDDYIVAFINLGLALFIIAIVCVTMRYILLGGYL